MQPTTTPPPPRPNHQILLKFFVPILAIGTKNKLYLQDGLDSEETNVMELVQFKTFVVVIVSYLTFIVEIYWGSTYDKKK